ncbi:hypothetical protein FPZ42_16835 [Mucilaginibacter achroorhodeus]|uniref:Uncharacterized protein n=1 Tax=Mucilaginibacter achroorhodeus TaxID=2599294 RepID=A0A563TY27_9SPHI|nr:MULTISPECIES: hypothetical protein [Mucilaginibacter]QXV65941.1 hypothetical protein INP83_02260 [Mucilaginibacter sp. 21P]TWR24153.1 hypothetical protein FPZ42_16835 [Mucilaginibacter achroorhodeus]
MNRKTYFKLIFVLAAIFFVAKPFIGFVLHARLSSIDEHPTILVKSFTKYRLDSLNDTEFCKDVTGDLTPQALLPFAFGIAALLSLLFGRFKLLQKTFAFNYFSLQPLVPSQPVYLTTRHLSI